MTDFIGKTATIKVCDMAYHFEFMSSWKHVSHDPDSAPRHTGEIRYIDNSIRIDGSRHDDLIDVTVWHELVHAVVETMKIRELTDSDGNQLEHPVSQLAVGLSSATRSIGVHLSKELINHV